MKYNILLSRPVREYRLIEDLEASSEMEARRLALSASRLLDQSDVDATFADLGLSAPCDIGGWSTWLGTLPPQRVERVDVNRVRKQKSAHVR